MEDNKHPILLIVFGVVVFACVGIPLFITAQIGALTNANAARVAEANAVQAQTQAIAAQANVEAERAAGERAVLEAAAAAVENNTELVNYQARRGDTRLALVLVVAVFVLGRVKFEFPQRKSDVPKTNWVD